MAEYTCHHMNISEMMPTLISLYTEAMLRQNSEEQITEHYNVWIGKSTKGVH